MSAATRPSVSGGARRDLDDEPLVDGDLRGRVRVAVAPQPPDVARRVRLRHQETDPTMAQREEVLAAARAPCSLSITTVAGGRGRGAGRPRPRGCRCERAARPPRSRRSRSRRPHASRGTCGRRPAPAASPRCRRCDHLVAGCAQRLLDPRGERRVERVLDHGHDHADRAARPLLERPGGCVRDVAEPFGHGHQPFPHVRRDVPAPCRGPARPSTVERPGRAR